MKLEEFFKEAKKDYFSIAPPERVLLYGWLEVRDKLEKKVRPRDILVWFLLRPTAAFALAILLLVGGAAGLIARAQESLPGETLYPVKRLYEDIALAVTGDNEIKVEGRAQEIIILSQREQQDSKKLKEAVIEYEVTVAEVKEKVVGEEREKLKERLKRHKEKFEKIYKEARSKEEIKKAIEATENEDSHQD